MNRAIEIVKQNPWKVTFGTIITIAITIGSYYFTDMRYSNKSDVEVQIEEMGKRIDLIEKQVEELIEINKR